MMVDILHNAHLKNMYSNPAHELFEIRDIFDRILNIEYKYKSVSIATRNIEIFKMRVYHNMTYEDISEAIGLSIERVRQIYKQIMRYFNSRREEIRILFERCNFMKEQYMLVANVEESDSRNPGTMLRRNWDVGYFTEYPTKEDMSEAIQSAGFDETQNVRYVRIEKRYICSE